MPTQTFFRLPDKKRERLTEAAWSEFTAMRYDEVSINRIVHAAQIPRGSFYQYFEDKKDLFFYLLSSLREEFFALVDEAMRETKNNPFDMLLHLFDEVFLSDGSVRPTLARAVEVMRLNQTMDVIQMVNGQVRADRGLWELFDRVDRSILLRSDPEYLQAVGVLLTFSFANAVRNILCDGAAYAGEREKLCLCLDVLRRGSGKEEMVS